MINVLLVEFFLSAIKVAGLIGFIILGVVIDCGGVGSQGYLGAKYWRTYNFLCVSLCLYFVAVCTWDDSVHHLRSFSKNRVNDPARVNVNLAPLLWHVV